MKKLDINEDEEMCLRKLIMTNKNEKPSDWDDSGFPSDDSIKRGQLQAIIRRLQGIVANMSRVPVSGGGLSIWSRRCIWRQSRREPSTDQVM